MEGEQKLKSTVLPRLTNRHPTRRLPPSRVPGNGNMMRMVPILRMKRKQPHCICRGGTGLLHGEELEQAIKIKEFLASIAAASFFRKSMSLC
jgi:hypothetical protein